MPISKVDGVITYTAKGDKWSSDKTGVYASVDFAVADTTDPTKQLKFDTSGLAEDTAVTVSAPAVSGTMAVSGQAGLLQFAEPVTTGTVAYAAATEQLIIAPAGTLAELTVTLPAASDGKRIKLCSSKELTSLTLTAAGMDTLANTPTTIAAGGFMQFTARSGVWYRTG